MAEVVSLRFAGGDEGDGHLGHRLVGQAGPAFVVRLHREEVLVLYDCPVARGLGLANQVQVPLRIRFLDAFLVASGHRWILYIRKLHF